jgi:hypothetical protein
MKVGKFIIAYLLVATNNVVVAQPAPPPPPNSAAPLDSMVLFLLGCAVIYTAGIILSRHKEHGVN